MRFIPWNNSAGGPPSSTYLRPDGVSYILRPDGSYILRP